MVQQDGVQPAFWTYLDGSVLGDEAPDFVRTAKGYLGDNLIVSATRGRDRTPKQVTLRGEKEVRPRRTRSRSRGRLATGKPQYHWVYRRLRAPWPRRY